eukprot:364208-Chlamydomonas_euryale.AAC.16
MDKKFGAPWHVVVGRGFSYEVTYEVMFSCRKSMPHARCKSVAHKFVANMQTVPSPQPPLLPRQGGHIAAHGLFQTGLSHGKGDMACAHREAVRS